MTGVVLYEHELSLIRETLGRFPDVSAAILYGSRAKGTAKPTSDIDLALEGVERGVRSAWIAAELEELPMIAKFDVQALADITHAPLLEHIERVGVRIYERAEGIRRRRDGVETASDGARAPAPSELVFVTISPPWPRSRPWSDPYRTCGVSSPRTPPSSVPAP